VKFMECRGSILAAGHSTKAVLVALQRPAKGMVHAEPWRV
jgi:hypothetical protein